ncbi:hypothetical protein GH714_018366 [Hevea brasiliensis]|uniref:Bet v I/Major latex protein domain-containing protein n=1 Tax=Hevea brasiliensis TaxID=3981 RepID=A0A6A6MNE1_HEVBR|nr:hypothetical protein GH714_018366 [Hevea brasiliensis]
MNVLEQISNETKFEASAAGGSIFKNNSTYFTVGDLELEQEQIKAGKEKSLEIFKAILIPITRYSTVHVGAVALMFLFFSSCRKLPFHLLLINFCCSQFKYSKHKIEAIDKENLKFSHSVIEGDMLMNVIEKITYYIKFQQSPDGGCICKESSNYHTIGDFKLNKDQLKAGKEKALGMFKAVEAYLLANPDAC